MTRYAVFLDAPDHMTWRDVQAMLANELPRLFGGDPDVEVYESADEIRDRLESGEECVGTRTIAS